MKTIYSIIWGRVSDVLWRNFKTMNCEADAQVY